MEGADKPEPLKAPQTRRIIAAAALYFAIVFGVGLVLGPVRVLWVEPFLGETIAALCEAPLLLLAMGFAGRRAPSWVGMRGPWPAYLAVGALALIFQQIADLAVAFGLRGMTLHDQLSYFATPAGAIYAVLLVLFALMPLIVRMRAARQRP